jgi:hypothetical protein
MGQPQIDGVRHGHSPRFGITRLMEASLEFPNDNDSLTPPPGSEAEIDPETITSGLAAGVDITSGETVPPAPQRATEDLYLAWPLMRAPDRLPTSTI